ncbi:hypothetical protein E1281_39760, partial [Actinomadura sp. KC345]
MPQLNTSHPRSPVAGDGCADGPDEEFSPPPSPAPGSSDPPAAHDAGAGSLGSAVLDYLGHLAVERGLAANTLSS